MNRIFLLVLFLLSNLVNAQFKSIEFKLSAVYPIINDTEETHTAEILSSGSATRTTVVLGSTEANYSSSLSYCVQSNVHFSLSRKLSLSTGIGLQHVKFKREFKSISINNGLLGQVTARDVNGNLIIDNTTTVSGSNIFNAIQPPVMIYYLDIPLNISYSITKRLIGNVGVSLAARVYSRTKGYVLTVDFNTGQETWQEETHTDGRTLNSSQLFLSAGLDNKIWKNIFTTITYKRSMSPIFVNESEASNKARYNLIGLGISYRFPKLVIKQS